MVFEALGPELAVERFHEGIVGRLAGPREVEDDAIEIRPEIEFLEGELGTVIDPDALRPAVGLCNPFDVSTT
jgi:hypothetical protein